MVSYNYQLTKSILQPNENAAIFFNLIILLNSKSSGEILLKSTDPFDAPIIRANYLNNNEDLKTLIRGIRFMQQLIQTQAHRRHEIEEVPLDIPECNSVDDHSSDQYYDCVLRHIITTLFHPSDTAKMGPENDENAVVDSRLRVKGVKGLRVADADIMPNIASGNINAPTIMIGKFEISPPLSLDNGPGKHDDFLSNKFTSQFDGKTLELVCGSK